MIEESVDGPKGCHKKVRAGKVTQQDEREPKKADISGRQKVFRNSRRLLGVKHLGEQTERMLVT